MAKRKRRKAFEIEQPEASFEVDLTPVLSLMVCLIPIMLLSTVFARLTVIETPLPQVVEKAIEKDEKNKDREISIVVEMTDKKEMQLILTSQSGKVNKKKISSQAGDWNFGSLRDELIRVKKSHPEVFQLSLAPSEQVAYSEIVKFMDEVRSARQGEPAFPIVDSESGEKAQTQLMYPNVSLSNVVGG